jgi:hypothetical protein
MTMEMVYLCATAVNEERRTGCCGRSGGDRLENRGEKRQ